MADDSKKLDSNRIVAFSLLGIAFVVFLMMGLEIGVNTEENMDSGPVWWQVGPHAVGTLTRLTADEAEVKTDTGTETFVITNHTMMVAFGGPMVVGHKVLVKYLSGQHGKVARVLRTLNPKNEAPAASGSPPASSSSSAEPPSPSASASASTEPPSSSPSASSSP